MRNAGTLMIGGKEYVVLEREEYDSLRGRAARATEPLNLPALPKPDASGNVPAVEYSRASLARKLILARREVGLSQAELARQSGIRVETLNRLEKGKHTADVATIDKIEAAIKGTARSVKGRRGKQT